MSIRLSLLLGLVALLSTPHARGAEDSPVRSKSFYPEIARVVADGLPRAHFSHANLGDSIAEKALENYLSVLDFDRTYFLATDVESFRKIASELDDQLRDGHLAFAYEVFELFKTRAADRVAYVEELLKKDFDFTLEESYPVKRKDAPWPLDADERNDLWRKKIKNELLGRRIAKAMAEEFPPPAEDEVDEDLEEIRAKPPEELVSKMHGQFLTVLNGHDAEWVLQAYLNAFTQAYDSHSAYLSPRAEEDFNIAMKLSLTGIGAVLKYDDGAAKIVRLIAGGPAEQDGRLQAGDRIIAVSQGDDEPVDILYWPLYKSVRLIRGTKGSSVVLTVIPASDPSGAMVRNIDLVRETIKLEDRAAKSDVREVPGLETEQPFKLGVITLPDFYADQQGLRQGKEESKSCAQDVRRLLEDLKTDSVDGILLDLRNNGGGSLQEAIEMTGFFIDRGPIVQVKAGRRQILRDPNADTVYDGPLIVLVNRLSASASEILAGALQDYGRAVIVGDTKTHGKGTVQSVFPLDRKKKSLGSLKVTTAKFYRVDGHSTQLKGVQPDIVLPSPTDVMEIGEEFLPNVMQWSWVAPARYTRFARTPENIDLLRKSSEKRRDASEDFASFNDLIQRLKTRLEMTEISLNFDARMEMARADKELNDLQDSIRERMSRTSEKDKEDSDGDIVLGEALQILRDLVASQSEALDS